MKYLFFTDMHATIKHGLFGMKFLDQVSGTFKFISDVANREGVDAVFFLGDVFHFKQSIDTPSLHTVKEGFRSLIESTEAFPIYVIPGNHDLYKKDGLWTSVSALSDLAPSDRVHVIDKEKNLTIDRVVVKVVPFTELGYGRDDDANFMVGHLEVSGVMYRPGGMIEEHGVNNNFGLQKEGSIYYIGGHYHHPQIVGQSLVVGACLYHSYQDQVTDYPRGAVLLELDSPRTPVISDFRWVENPYACPIHTIRAKTHEEVEDELKRLKSICGIPPQNWKIRTFLPSAEATKVNKRKMPKGVQCTIIPDDPVATIQRTSISTNMSAEDAFREYVRITPPSSDMDRILSTGIKLIRGDDINENS